MSKLIFPDFPTDTEWETLPIDETILHEALKIVGARHNLAMDRAVRNIQGFAPVLMTDAYAVKFLPPEWRDEAANEVAALERVHGRLPARTPVVVAVGEIEGWTYLVTERLSGVIYFALGPTLNLDERVFVSRQTGEALAALHQVPCEGLAVRQPDWDEFSAECVTTCVEHQRRKGLCEATLSQLPSLIKQGQPLIPDERRVLLHADLHSAHVLFEQQNGRWKLTGILDFGDAIVGHPEYDIVTPAFYIAGPNTVALQALFEPLGFRCDEESSQRLMAWSALHPYNDLARHLPPEQGADELGWLRKRYWPVLTDAEPHW